MTRVILIDDNRIHHRLDEMVVIGREDALMATLAISLPDDMIEWIVAQVASGDYPTVSDYLLDLIRNDQLEAVELALIEGEQSGISQRKVEEIIANQK